MLNAERFKEEILNIVNDDFSLAVNKNNPNEVCKCGSFPCTVCMFSKLKDGKVRCTRNKVNWLLAEYKEPVKVSSLEHELLKFWDNEDFKYIARDSGGTVFLYREKPSKKTKIWASIHSHRILDDFNERFQFIKWEDEEPTSIKDVLKKCEVVEDAEE